MTGLLLILGFIVLSAGFVRFNAQRRALEERNRKANPTSPKRRIDVISGGRHE